MPEPPHDRVSQWARWITFAFATYLLPAIVVIVDEEYFHWIAGHLSPGFSAVFCIFYPWVCNIYGG